MTSKEFDKKVLELIQQIKDKTAAFINDTKDLQLVRKKQAAEDLFFFAKTYFPHYIDKPFGKFHCELHEKTSKDKVITAVAGPRAHGKTVLLSIIKPLWLALHEKKKFLAFVSDNEDLAKERTVAIQLELIYNKRIIHDFGEQLKVATGAESDFVISEGARFLALGYKQPIRGKLHGHYRPDYIVIDDFESHTSRNPKIAKSKLEYVREEAFGALPDKTGNVVWLGNLTHKESALFLFKKACIEESSDQLIFLLYKAIKDDGSLLWPEGYSHQDLMTIKAAMGTLGFERHFQMNPITEGIKFKSAWFKYNSVPGHFDSVVTAVDPSLGKGQGNDYKAIITVALAKERYYLLDVWIRKASINDMLRKMYAVDQQFDTTIFMESIFWQSILWEFIPPLSSEFGYLLPVAGIESKIKKEVRIEKLQPLYEFGWINHYEPKDDDLIILEEQLTNFPDHPNDDGPDALEMCIRSLKFNAMKQEYRSAGKRLSTKFKRMM